MIAGVVIAEVHKVVVLFEQNTERPPRKLT